MVRLRISHNLRQVMLDHVAKEAPREACGLLGGAGTRVDVVVPIKNIAASTYRFQMDPAEQVHTLFDFEARNLELVGIYHSHPNGPPGPSQIDLNEAHYPEAVQFIWFQELGEWNLRAYIYEADGAVEVSVDSGEEQDR